LDCKHSNPIQVCPTYVLSDVKESFEDIIPETKRKENKAISKVVGAT